MDQLCVRCARRTLGSWNVTTNRAQIGTRSFFLSARSLEDKSPSDSGVAQAGASMNDALTSSKKPASQGQRPLIIRRVSEPESGPLLRKTSSASPSPVIRRSAPRQGNENRPPGDRSILRGTSVQPGQLLRRVGTSGTAQASNRTRDPIAAGRPSGPRPAGSLLRRTGPVQGQAQGRQPRQQGAGQRGQRGQNGPDRRRRRAANQDEGEFDDKLLEEQMADYIAKHVDRPANPTQPIPYNPTQLTLEDLKADWPTTPISTSGITESVVQKIEWLARRLPHGYQSPEQIAEHYLKGNLTRFESEEEKQTVLKLASELSNKTKIEAEDGTLHKHESPRFRAVDDPAFASVASNSGDKGHLIDSSVKGNYGEAGQQKFAFMQNAERILNNNETYGSAQTQKLLARVQSLIPQGRAGGAQQAKQARRA